MFECALNTEVVDKTESASKYKRVQLVVVEQVMKLHIMRNRTCHSNCPVEFKPRFVKHKACGPKLAHLGFHSGPKKNPKKTLHDQETFWKIIVC